MGRASSSVRRLARPAAGLALALAAREALDRRREADLRGQVVVITGGTRGLGLALARHFAAEGCLVAICARDDDELERARADLAARGADVLAVRADVGDRDDAERLVRAATDRFGRVDVLVNNAGFIQVGPLQTATPEDFQRALNTMLFGILYPTLAVLPQMRERHAGRIVNVTSVGGKISLPHMLPYGTAKFAAVGLSEGLHAELAADGITVTTVCPGELRTGSYQSAVFAGRKEEEFRWFGLGAALPTTMSAERAARGIVRATKRGYADFTFPWTVGAYTRLHGLFPGTTAAVLALVNRLLPSREGTGPGTERGAEVEPRVRGAAWDLLTTAGRRAADDLHQHPGPLGGNPPEEHP